MKNITKNKKPTISENLNLSGGCAAFRQTKSYVELTNEFAAAQPKNKYNDGENDSTLSDFLTVAKMLSENFPGGFDHQQFTSLTRGFIESDMNDLIALFDSWTAFMVKNGRMDIQDICYKIYLWK